MTTNSEYRLPTWAPRLRKSQVERLYKSCGQGVLDEELIDDVGFSLYARCKSMLEVTASVRGKPVCPECGAAVERSRGPEAMLDCPSCGWKCPWKAYKKTHQRKGLFAGGMEPFVREFVEKFRTTRSHSERLVLIDTLIHRFHWESGDKPGGRPSAVSLIEGKMKDIMPFLDRLTYGDNVPPQIEETRERWRNKWSRNAWAHGKGQG